MLINRVEKDGVITSIYDSSNILISEYVKNDKELSIVFKSGIKYKYKSVESDRFHNFELSESQGKTFNTHIKQHEFEKIGKVDIDVIYAEVNRIKQQEIHNLDINIIQLCALLKNEFADSESLKIETIKDMEIIIKKRLELE